MTDAAPAIARPVAPAGSSSAERAPARPADAPAIRSKVRVPFWDNARFVTVALVVMGHAIQRQTSDSNTALALYLFVYAFHMPAFAVISGYFSKASPPSSRQLLKILSDIIVPYVIFQSIWSGVQWIVEGNTKVDLAQPHWTLWFLLSLAVFRILMPYLVLLRFPLLWAVILSVAVGYSPGVDSTFSLARTIGILPFFVLGWQLRQWKVADWWMRLRAGVWPIRIAALVVFGVWAAVVILNVALFRNLSVHWFFYDDSYQGLDAQDWWAGFVRLGLLLLTTILCAAFFALIPRRQTFWTSFGQATMYVYLLHSFVLYPIRESGVLKNDHSSATWLLTMVFASHALAIALSSPLIRRIFRPLVEPKPRWLFIKLEEPARPSRVDPTGSRRSR
jgi:fucose 4-O-acetylase-like acetyltransferase